MPILNLFGNRFETAVSVFPVSGFSGFLVNRNRFWFGSQPSCEEDKGAASEGREPPELRSSKNMENIGNTSKIRETKKVCLFSNKKYHLHSRFMSVTLKNAL